MNRETRTFIFFGLFITGFALCMFKLFNPMHEAWHVIGASIEGVDAKILSPTETQVDIYTPFIIYMGYYGEFLTFLILCFFLHKWTAAGIPFGAAHATAYFRAPNSLDFRVHALKVLSPKGVEIAVIRWYILVTIILLVGWYLIIRRHNDLSETEKHRPIVT